MEKSDWRLILGLLTTWDDPQSGGTSFRFPSALKCCSFVRSKVDRDTMYGLISHEFLVNESPKMFWWLNSLSPNFWWYIQLFWWFFIPTFPSTGDLAAASKVLLHSAALGEICQLDRPWQDPPSDEPVNPNISKKIMTHISSYFWIVPPLVIKVSQPEKLGIS